MSTEHEGIGPGPIAPEKIFSNLQAQGSTAQGPFARVAADLTQGVFPELADAIIKCTTPILKKWREASFKAMPDLDEYTITEFEDGVAAVLHASADALRTQDPQALLGVMNQAPEHGVDRFLQKYTLLDLLEEVRILRGVLIVALAEEIGRPLQVGETANFHAIFDLIIQQGVMKLVQLKEDDQDVSEATMRRINEALVTSNDRLLQLAEQAHEAQEASHESELRYRAFLAASSDVVFKMSSDWVTRFPLDGRGFVTATEQASTNWMEEYVYPEDQPRVMAAINDAIRTQRLFEMEHRVRRADGTVGWTSSRAVPLLNDRGEVAEWFGVASDITERKTSEDLLRRNHDTFFNLIENAPFGLYIVSADFHLLQVSRASQDIFANVRPLIGRDFSEVLRTVWAEPFASEAIGRFQHTLATGEPYHAPNTTQPRGDIAEVQSNDWKIERITLPDGQHGVVCYFYDISERIGAQEKLRESDEFSRSIIESSPDCIKVLDLEGKLLSIECGLELLGIEDVEQFLNTSWIEFWSGEHRVAARAAVEAAAAGGTGNFVGFFRTLREEAKWWDVAITPILDSVGKPVRLLAVSRDVTERNEIEEALKESEVRYRRLFQSAKDGILILDGVNGNIIDANDFLAELVGVDASELLGKNLCDVGIFPKVDDCDAMTLELSRSGYVRHEQLPLTDQNVVVELIANTYEVDGKLVAQCNVRDVTDRVELERLVQKQTRALEEESRRKDEFLAMLSHELRNPLAPVASALHLLKIHATNESPIQSQAREVIERQVGNLTKLVSDLMEVSRVISGRIRLDMRPVDIKKTVDHALQTVGPLIENRKHSVSLVYCSDHLWAEADPTRLEEVLVNLLGNAAKYTPDGGAIEVACELQQDYALVRVRDNGVGIDKELLPCIFDLFTQADRSLDRSAGGLGIGLSIAHRLMEMHGGTLEAHSPPPGHMKGSEFVVRLPLIAALAPEVVQPPVSNVVRPANLRVLMVDDNIDLVAIVTKILQAKGYDVQCAYNGMDGLALGLQWRPDIVLLDIGLPGLSGYEVARSLRADSRAAMRLIALTGYGRDADIALAHEAGFDGHMTKPFNFDELEKLMSAEAALTS